jgi:hypothetical protein
LANRESSAEAAYYNKLIQQQQATDKKMLSDVGKEIKFNVYYE